MCDFIFILIFIINTIIFVYLFTNFFLGEINYTVYSYSCKSEVN